MEFVDTNFKDDFPFFSTIFLEINPKHDCLSMMGNSNVNNFPTLLNNHSFINSFSSHPHQHHQDVHGHGHDVGHGHHPIDSHHHGVFSTDLNFDPPFVMSENDSTAADGYHHDHGSGDHQHGVCHHGDGDEPMIPLEHILTFHDLNMMPEDDTGSPESPIADADEKKKKKKKRVVVAHPLGEAVTETPQAPTKTNMIKGQWTPEEDRLLIQLVERHGVKRWSLIARKLGGRVGKQCRERWHNHLRPDIRKDVWSLEEDMILIDTHREVGNRWCEIAKRLPGRTENTIKNHWNATKRKQLSRRSRPAGGSGDGSGSTLLQDYIRSTIPLSLLINNNNNDKNNNNRKRNKRNCTSASEMAPADNRTRNFDLELPPPGPGNGEWSGPCGCGMGYLLFCQDQAETSGTSEEPREAVRKEMDLLEMISHRHA